jgi:hypothetical protein
MGEAGGGVCGAMVESHNEKALKASREQNTRLLKGDEIRRVSSLMVSQRLCIPFCVSPQSHLIPAAPPK